MCIREEPNSFTALLGYYLFRLILSFVAIGQHRQPYDSCRPRDNRHWRTSNIRQVRQLTLLTIRSNRDPTLPAMSICDNVSRFFFYKTSERFLFLFCFAATKLLRVATLVTVGFAVADTGRGRAAPLALEMSVVPSRSNLAVVAVASLASLRRTLSVLDVEVAETCSDCLWNFNKTKLCKHVVSDLGLLSQTHTLSEYLHAFFSFILIIIALD